MVSLLFVIKRTIAKGSSDIKYSGYFKHLVLYIIAQLFTHVPYIFNLAQHGVYILLKERYPDSLWEKLLRDCSKTVTGLIFAVVYCCNNGMR